MKLFFAIIVLFGSIQSFSKAEELINFDDQKEWRFSYLPFEMFLQLPAVSQKEYIRLARSFLIQQEMRKAKDYTSLLNGSPLPSLFLSEVVAAEPSPLTFPDNNGRCNYLGAKSTMPIALKEIVRKGRDQCVVAGHPVCMTVIENGEKSRILCKLDKMTAVTTALRCSDENPNLIVCGSLFINADGSIPCVDAKAGSTEACEKVAPKIEDVIKYFKKNPSAKAKYEAQFAKIRRYCGPKDNANLIDLKDCDILNQRLRQLEIEIPDAEKTQTVADCTYKARDEAPVLKTDLRMQFREKGSVGYQVQATGKELKLWNTSDGAGRLQAIDQGQIENSNHKTLRIGRWFDAEKSFMERFEPNFNEKIKSDCKASMTLKHNYSGSIKDNNCVVQLKKREGGLVEFKIPVTAPNGDERFRDGTYNWTPEEIPKLPDLAGTPKESKVSYIVTAKISSGCTFGIRWDIDGTPTPAKGSGGKTPKPESQNR